MVSPELIRRLPGRGFAFVGLDVNLNVLEPVLNLSGGGGDARGSLKKNDPPTSPNVSVTTLTSLTDACAPLVLPTRTTLLFTNPKKVPWTSSESASASIFRTVEDAEYVVGRLTDLS